MLSLRHKSNDHLWFTFFHEAGHLLLQSKKAAFLEELNLLLEQLRVLWRLVHGQAWMSQQQLVFIIGRIDEAGRMTGGWLRQA